MSDSELKKMILSFRVSDLQVLLGFAGRNKSGKKNELQRRALELIKLRSPAVELKIRELQKRRYQQGKTNHCDPQDIYPLSTLNQPMGSSYGNSSNLHVNMSGSNMVNFQTSHNKPNLNPLPPNIIPPYAVNPDVKFKELPFYDVLAELFRPSSLVPMVGERFQERDFIFHLSPHQAHEVSVNNDVQVQLRICLLETSCDQEDNFPSSICVKVNKKVAPLPNPIPTNKPGVDPKRPSRPVDITAFCRLTPTLSNEIHISWASSYGRAYVVAVFLVRKQNSTVLIQRLKANGVRNPDHTTAMIKEKLCQDRDSEIATMSLRGSLICPLGKIKMKLPCRALTCTHLQCFDATLYIQMNEKKPKWICPVCDKPAIFKALAIDGLFLDITTKAPAECTEVQFHENGSWTPVMPVKNLHEVNDTIIGKTPKKEIPKPKKPVTIEVVDLDSDSDTEDSWPVTQCLSPPIKKPFKSIGVISPIVVPQLSSKPAVSETITKKFMDDIHSELSSDTADTKLYDAPTLSEKSGSIPQPSKQDSSSTSSYVLSPISPTGSVANSPSYTDGAPMSPSICAPMSGAFTEQLEILSGTQSTSGLSNFDLYSLISQNQADHLSFLPVIEEDRSVVPDVISLD